jgi:diaminohydroxyphosphoribosylaminopyrimidine deaminase/5-amino-6-(5-phosphoribosylamino)uracil reductase
LRVVVDSHLRTPPAATILQGGGVLVVCCDDSIPRAVTLRDAGAEVLALPGSEEAVSLPHLLTELARRGINELHVEAGAKLNGELLRLGLIDELLFYVAPTLLGASARGMFDFPALTRMTQRGDLDIVALDRVDQDIRIRARPR